MLSAIHLIESVSDYNVTFIGDRIIDEYRYVVPLGKSAKENLIPVRSISSEVFNGGVEAAAEHVRGLVKTVNVRASGLTRKIRFVDENYLRKLFEVQHHTEAQSFEHTTIPGSDCIVVCDFGHGAISPQMIKTLEESPHYLAVSAQTNSSNIGFNLITKYRKADYVVIDEPEARLAASDRTSSIEDVIYKLAHGCFSKMIVTHGRHGATGWSDESGFRHCNSFGDRALDTMGAGDAFFAVTAPMSKHGSIKDLLLIGNAAGSLKTQIIGHRRSITKAELIWFLKEHETV